MKVKAITLIPLPISENQTFITQEYHEVFKSTTHYAVEDVRTARRFISSLKLGLNIETLHFFVLDKKTSEVEVKKYLDEVDAERVGVMSEAGCPGVADPGQLMVKIAHQKNINVKPLIGPSSILLALMASGLNGQNFAFIGYVPIQQEEKAKRIKQLSKHVLETGQTQIFIETPYRNNSLIKDLIKNLDKELILCVAQNLSSESELISCHKISWWEKTMINLDKTPCIFLIGKA
ncbi:MAG: SAM-dependent methyltransferase [Cytophagales bacterium]